MSHPCHIRTARYCGREQAELTKVALRGNGTLKMSDAFTDQQCTDWSAQMCCIVSSRPWMYEDWLIHLTMTTSSASAFKTLDEVYLTVHRQSAVIFSCYSVLSVLYLHRLTFWCVSWLTTTDQSLPLFEDIWIDGTKWVTLLPCGCLQMRKVSRCSDSKMTDSERLCVCAFSFSKLVDFLLNSTERALP